MADVIKPDDLFEDGLFDDLGEGAKEASRILKELTETVKDLSQATKEKLQIVDVKDYQSIVKLNQTIEESNKQIKLHSELSLKDLKIQQEQEKVAQQTQKTKQASIKTEREQLKNSQLLEKQKERETKANQRLNGAYAQASKRLTDLRNKYKDLILSGKGNEATTQRLGKVVQDLDQKLKKVDSTVGQFNRHVGDYRGGVRAALQDTGIFGGTLGNLVQSLTRTAEGFKNASKAGKGFGSGMKLLAAGALGAAIVSLKAVYDTSIVLQDGFDSVLASIKDLVGNGFSELDKAQKKFRDSSRFMRIELEKLTLEQEDFNEIAGDETLGFKAREEAARKALEFEEKRSKVALNIAKAELDIAQKAVKADKSIGTGKADPKLLDELTAKLIAFEKAQDDVNDAERHFQERLREIGQKQVKSTVNALQSVSDARTNALKKQIEDEKTQLEEREILLKKSESIESKLFDDELKAFEKLLGKKLDGNKLLKKDGEALQELVEKENLGTKAQAILINAINKRQASLLANETALKKLEEDKIKRQQKLLEIQAQIEIANQQRAVESAQEEEDLARESKEKNLEILFQKEQVFDRKKLKAREIILQREKEEQQETFDEQFKLIELQRDLELQQAQNSITDLQILEKTKQEIRNKFRLQEEKLSEEFQAKQIANRTKDLEDEKKIRDEQFKIVAQYANRSLDAIEAALDKREQRQEEALDRESEKNQTELERQRERAEKGLNNELVFEEQKQAQLEVQREEAAKREENRQLYLGFIKSWAQYAEQDPDTALKFAARDLGLAKLGEVLFLAEGAEAIKGPGTTTSDSIPAMLSKGESVVNAEGTATYPGLASAMNDKKVGEYFAKTYLGNDNIAFSGSQSNDSLKELRSINSRLQSLESTMYNKTENTWKMDNLGNVILDQTEKGLRRVITFKTRRPRI